jgi:hypothetical protein
MSRPDADAATHAHCELAQRRQVRIQRSEPGCRGSHDPLLAWGVEILFGINGEQV